MTASVLRQMGANENPLGPSPHAQAAMAQALADAHRYPDPDGLTLKRALQRRFGLDPQWLLVGNGSSELIDLAARSLLGRGDEAVHSQYAFVSYPLAIRVAGGTAVEAPARDFGHDLAALRAAVGPRTRLVFIANPNNPTGTRLQRSALRDFLRDLPPQVVVLLDEAYVDYQPEAERVDGFALAREFANLIVARTFSKAYGLAGLRVGYAVAQPELLQRLDAMRPIYNANLPALHGAAAALDDEDFLAASRRVNDAGRAQLQAGFARLGLAPIASSGNFVAVGLAGAAQAEAVHRRLLDGGFATRRLAGPWGLPDHLRVTVGRTEDNAALLTALAGILGREPA
jgi:histidinol-phosphate aminotransferase